MINFTQINKGSGNKKTLKKNLNPNPSPNPNTYPNPNPFWRIFFSDNCNLLFLTKNAHNKLLNNSIQEIKVDSLRQMFFLSFT